MVKKFTVEIDITPELREKVGSMMSGAVERAVARTMNPCKLCKIQDTLKSTVGTLEDFGVGDRRIDNELCNILNSAKYVLVFYLYNHKCQTGLPGRRPR